MTGITFSPLTGVTIPLPPLPGAWTTAAAIDMLAVSDLTKQLQAAYGDLCTVPAMADVIPDSNAYFHFYGMTRQSFLDIFMSELILKGFDASFATELATGMYGLESIYGGNTGYTGSYCGPLQVNGEWYGYWYNLAHTTDPAHYPLPQVPATLWLNANVQYKGIAFAAWNNYQTLLSRFPNGTWAGGENHITPFDVYMMHQQGQSGYPRRIDLGPDYSPVSNLNGYKQAGFGTLYNGQSTLGQFFAAEKALFDKYVIRAGGDNCGEFAVQFLAGST